MAKIALEKVGKNLYESLVRAVDLLGEVELSSQDRVLIKPNIVEPLSPRSGRITNPELVDAIIRWCKGSGVREIVLGEGPSYYVSEGRLLSCFTGTGYKEVAERHGINWVIFDHHPHEVFSDKAPCLPREFGISRFAFDMDKIINVPVLKTHYLARVTLAMKNLKGFLRREDKPRFHSHLVGAIVELNKLVKPYLNIVDGTLAEIPVLVAGRDIVATDSVAASLMGLNPGSVDTIRLGAEAGLGTMDLTRISLVGQDLAHLKMNFELPQETIRKRFQGLRILDGKGACSGCLIPMLSALAYFEERGGRLNSPLTLILGKGISLPENGEALFLGDCAKGTSSEGLLIEGCPPDRGEIIRALRKYFL
jgi:uncharacterized protein (DUF362 family)